MIAPGGHGEHGIAIPNGVAGTDGQSQPVVALHRQEVGLFPGEHGVGGDHTDGGIGQGRGISGNSLQQNRQRIVQAVAIFPPGSGDYPPGTMVNYATVSVHRHHRGYDSAAWQGHAGGPDATLEGAVHAPHLGHRGPGSRADGTLFHGIGAGCQACRVALFGTGTDFRVNQPKVKQDGRRNDGHQSRPRLEPDSLFGQVINHSRGCVQTKGTASAEQHSVHLVYPVGRTQQVGLTGPRRTAPDIDAAHRALPANNHRTARGVTPVGVMSSLQPINAGNGGVQLYPQGSNGSWQKTKGKPRRSGA